MYDMDTEKSGRYIKKMPGVQGHALIPQHPTHQSINQRRTATSQLGARQPVKLLQTRAIILIAQTVFFGFTLKGAQFTAVPTYQTPRKPQAIGNSQSSHRIILPDPVLLSSVSSHDFSYSFLVLSPTARLWPHYYTSYPTPLSYKIPPQLFEP